MLKEDESEWSKMRKPDCPKCNSKNVTYILYGYPGHDALDAATKGEISLGGCCIDEDSKQWECNDCGAAWGKIEETEDEEEDG